jgi:hypothetical protein
VGYGVTGNTEDSDSFVLGSNPGTPALSPDQKLFCLPVFGRQIIAGIRLGQKLFNCGSGRREVRTTDGYVCSWYGLVRVATGSYGQARPGSRFIFAISFELCQFSSSDELLSETMFLVRVRSCGGSLPTRVWPRCRARSVVSFWATMRNKALHELALPVRRDSGGRARSSAQRRQTRRLYVQYFWT